MREKPANEKAVNNLILFLKQVKFQITLDILIDDFTYLQHEFKVAIRTKSDLKALKIISDEGNGKYKWIAKETDLRTIALQILNYRLEKSKKTVHYPIPGFAEITQSLKEISERLIEISIQHERLLKSNKIGQISNEKNDLFTIDSQRLQIACAIATGVYTNHNTQSIYFSNKLIIEATEDLLNKLLKKDN